MAALIRLAEGDNVAVAARGLERGAVVEVDGVELVVRDTGVGIASEDLAAIFDPFFTTKKDSGTGLGLSVTYTIVERYGGRITVASQPGEGTEFHLRLRRQAEFQGGPEAPGFMRRWKG